MITPDVLSFANLCDVYFLVNRSEPTSCDEVQVTHLPHILSFSPLRSRMSKENFCSFCALLVVLRVFVFVWYFSSVCQVPQDPGNLLF